MSVLGPDRNSGSGGIWAGSVPVPVDYRFYIIGFMMGYLDHLHPSSSQTASCALLQFPGCITCSPPVPRLYHVLPSSSQNVSCSPPPFGDTWRGKLSLFSPFVTYIDFTLSTAISAYLYCLLSLFVRNSIL